LLDHLSLGRREREERLDLERRQLTRDRNRLVWAH
jgi:hypothetical protein